MSLDSRPRFVLVTLILALLVPFSLTLAAHSAAQEEQPPSAPRVIPGDGVRPIVDLPLLTDDTVPPLDQRTAVAGDIPWSRLVYYGFTNGNYDIFISDDNGHGTVRLTTSPATEVSPDLRRGGQEIAFASNIDGDFDIYVMNPQGVVLRKLTDNSATDAQPVWSFDGSRLAFVSDRDGQPEVYSMNGDGSDVRRLTAVAGYDGDPTWSPDGTQIAFSSQRTGGYRIWVMNADGSGARQLSTQSFGALPAWSPDNQWIAYSAPNENDSYLSLHLMRPDGSEQGQIHSVYGSDLQVRSWAPDGSAIAYTHVDYVTYQGTEYINATFIRKYGIVSGNISNFASSATYPFDPAWQSLDAIIPTARMDNLFRFSPANPLIAWSGEDSGGSGLLNFDVQVQVDSGPWQDWKTAVDGTSATYFGGQSGERLGFRVRGRDRANNLLPWSKVPISTTTIEQWAPQTSVQPLPTNQRAGRPVPVNWGGDDPGGSGIAAFDVQFRVGDGAWTNWKTGTGANGDQFDPIAHGVAPGVPVAFRTRASDKAGNIEAWPISRDAVTTFHLWAVTGALVDNTGNAVANAGVSSAPAIDGPVRSDVTGYFGVFGTEAATAATLGWAKPGYGVLPLTEFSTVDDQQVFSIMPPADDVVVHGTFENAFPDPNWSMTGTPLPSRLPSVRLTGANGLSLAAIPALFGDPQQLTYTSGAFEHVPRVILVDGDKPIVLWLSDGGSTTNLNIAEQTADGNWTITGGLSNVTEEAYQVVQDAKGRVHVLAATSAGIAYTRRNAQGEWWSPSIIENSTGAIEPRMAAWAGESVHVVWYLPDNSIRYVEINPFGYPSVHPYLKGPDDYDIHSLAIGVGEDRIVHVLWQANLANSYTILLSGRDRAVDAVWAEPVLIDVLPSATDASLYRPEIDSDGRVQVIGYSFHLSGTAEANLYTQVNGIWQSPSTFMSGTNFGIGEPVFSASGLPRMIRGDLDSISLMWQQADGSWAEKQLIADYRTAGLDLFVGPDDTTHLVWSVYDSVTNVGIAIKYQRLTADGNWSAVLPGPKLGDTYGNVSLAVDPSGNVNLAWETRKSTPPNSTTDIAYAASPTASVASESSITQLVAIPADMNQPVLSFAYQFAGQRPGDGGLAVIVDGTPLALEPQPFAMAQQWVDLSAYAGQTVPLTFRLRQSAAAPQVWAGLDDVSVGSAYPDLWVAARGGSALPGETADITITIGNGGVVSALSAELTLELPTDLTFVSADIPPASTSPLRWELGDIAAESQRTLVVTLQVKPTASVNSKLVGKATVTAASELETLNNSAEFSVITRREVYLPGVVGP